MGTDTPVAIDVRIISATNRDIKHLAGQGAYRQDPYYRLAVIPIFVPPLRERRDDILPLVKHFTGKQKKHGQNPYSGSAMTPSRPCWPMPGPGTSGNSKTPWNTSGQ